MEKIAIQRIGTWLGDGFRTYFQNITGVLLFATVPILLITLGTMCTSFFGAFLSQFLVGRGVFGAMNIIVSILVAAIPQTICYGVTIAVLHGRSPDFDDTKQDLNTHIQMLLAFFLRAAAVFFVTLLAASPGIAMIFIGSTSDNASMRVIGTLLGLILGLPAALTVYTLTFFLFPLIVDKRIDFWSAFLMSIDCARRDFFGLATFVIVYYIISFGLRIILSILTICIGGDAVAVPIMAMITMMVYRDYFGLDKDHIQLETGLSGQFLPPSPPIEPAIQREQREIIQRPSSGFEPPQDGPPPPPEIEDDFPKGNT